MRTVAIVQARLTGGTRCPGKVLADVAGKPLIERVYDRLKLAESVEQIVFAIPDSEENDRLSEFIKGKGWLCVRGPEDDVLMRYTSAAHLMDADPIIRVTADCPFVDPGVVNRVVEMQAEGYDYAANNIEATFPHGLDVECFSFATLKRANDEAAEPFDREHVDPYITSHPELFKLGNIRCPMDLSHYRLTVDYPEDLELARAIYKALGYKLRITTADVLSYLDSHPEVMALNAHRRVA